MMNREELERKITEASDKELSPDEVADLELELKSWPKLQKDYYRIMKLPDIEAAFPIKAAEDHAANIDEIMGLIRYENVGNEPFTVLSLQLFKKYALAASILIIAGSSALFMKDNTAVNSQDFTEIGELYTIQTEATAIDNYMVEIDNLLLNENSDEN